MICIRVHVAPSRTFAVPFSLVLYGPHKMLLCSRSFLNTSLYASNTVTPPPQGIPFWGEGMWGVFMDIPKRLLNHLNQPPIPPTASSSRFQWYPALPKPLLSFLCSPHPASWLSCLGLCRTLLRKKYKAIDNTAQTIYVCHTYVCCVCMSVYLYIYICVYYTQTLDSTLDFWTLPTQICQKVSPHQKTTHKTLVRWATAYWVESQLLSKLSRFRVRRTSHWECPHYKATPPPQHLVCHQICACLRRNHYVPYNRPNPPGTWGDDLGDVVFFLLDLGINPQPPTDFCITNH